MASAQIVPVTARNAANGTPIYDIDQPGRIPYQSTVFGEVQEFSIFFKYDPVPDGHRLVIQQVSGDFRTDPVPQDRKLQGRLQNEGRNSISFTVAPFAQYDGFGYFTQPTQLYLDPGQVPSVILFSPDSLFRIGTMTLTGYELDCNVAPCAPIAGAKAKAAEFPVKRPVEAH